MYDSDDDNSMDGKAIEAHDVEIPIKLPSSVLYPWEDTKKAFVSQATVVLSGMSSSDVDYNIISAGKETRISMQGDGLLFLKPMEFWIAMGKPLHESHPKIVAHTWALKQLKKTTMVNSLSFIHTEKLPLVVEKDFASISTQQTGGSQITMMGKRYDPELTVSLEMKGLVDGFLLPKSMGVERAHFY